MEKIDQIIERLASSQGRKDEQPNIQLAKEICDKQEKNSVEILVNLLSHKDRAVQSDAIKVLYEMGEIDPGLISKFLPDFVTLLQSKNNRMQWGSMTAINAIASVKPKEVYENLGPIMAAVDKGSTITRDRAVRILIRLLGIAKYRADSLMLLFELLQSCPSNQLPMYAEEASTSISAKDQPKFTNILESRLTDMSKESKRRRLEKVIKRSKTAL